MTETTPYTLSKIIRNWTEYRIWWWFKEISDVVYKDWKLSSFTADGESYTLEYSKGRISKVTYWNKTYNITYAGSKFKSTEEI